MAEVNFNIPEGAEYDAIRFAIDRVRSTFPDELDEITAQRVAGWIAEVDEGKGRTADAIRDDIFKYIVGREVIMEVMGATAEEADALIAGGNDGGINFSEFVNDPERDDVIDPIQTGTGDAPGVLDGGKLVRITKKGQEDVWLQVYEFPAGSGNFIGYQYDDFAQVEQVHGTSPEWAKQSEDWLNNNVSIGGTAADNVMGATGNWQELVEDVKINALKAAGITDPTILSDYLNDPEIANIIAEAALGGWTDEQELAALRDTDYYKNVLFPGIEAFYDQTSNPEGAYAMYKQNVSSNLEAMGVPRDADGTYKTAIQQMLIAGVTDTEFADLAPTYIRAAANDVYRQNLNQWLVASGLDPITDFESFYDVLAGTTTPEIQQIVELASLSFTAEAQGLEFADEAIEDLAQATELSDADMRRIFSDTDRALIALGDKGLRTANITQQDVLRARAGLADPGGRTLAEMNNAINKAARELGIADDPTAVIFTDFNREGAPIKKGLQSSVSEGA